MAQLLLSLAARRSPNVCLQGGWTTTRGREGQTRGRHNLLCRRCYVLGAVRTESAYDADYQIVGINWQIRIRTGMRRSANRALENESLAIDDATPLA